jgi:hypothetical protein
MKLPIFRLLHFLPPFPLLGPLYLNVSDTLPMRSVELIWGSIDGQVDVLPTTTMGSKTPSGGCLILIIVSLNRMISSSVSR